MKLSDRLIFLREKTGYTKAQICDAVEISRTAYYYYELGEREPTASILAALADYFQVSVDYLLGRTDDLQGQAIAPAPPDPPDIKRIRDKLLTMDTKALKEVERYVDFVKSTK